MRHVIRYDHRVGPDAVMKVRLRTEGGTLVEYALALTFRLGDVWRTVRVFDNAHGDHEMHRYTRSGEKRAAERFHEGTASEAANAAKLWIVEGWEEMVDAWRR
jgi:hypothetical protein